MQTVHWSVVLTVGRDRGALKVLRAFGKVVYRCAHCTAFSVRNLGRNQEPLLYPSGRKAREADRGVFSTTSEGPTKMMRLIDK